MQGWWGLLLCLLARTLDEKDMGYSVLVVSSFEWPLYLLSGRGRAFHVSHALRSREPAAHSENILPSSLTDFTILVALHSCVVSAPYVDACLRLINHVPGYFNPSSARSILSDSLRRRCMSSPVCCVLWESPKITPDAAVIWSFSRVCIPRARGIHSLRALYVHLSPCLCSLGLCRSLSWGSCLGAACAIHYVVFSRCFSRLCIITLFIQLSAS